MKKFFFAICNLFIGWNTAHAQLQKGNLLLGSQIGNLFLSVPSQGSTQFGMGIYPHVGYFVANNFALGFKPMWAINISNRHFSNSFGIGVFSRYYINNAQSIVLNRGRFFLDGGVSLSNHYFRVKDNNITQINSSFYSNFYFGVGFAYFLSSNISMEALASFNGLSQIGERSTISNDFKINLGFQIHLPNKRLKDAYQDIKKSKNNATEE